jgi:energy-coupling factor transport system permease protein
METLDQSARAPEKSTAAPESRAEPVRSAHPAVWALWAVAAALLALTTRNPAYLTLLLLVVVVVRAAVPAGPAGTAGWSFFLRAGLLLWLITVPLNALTAHYGRTVLFSLPRTLPLIGSLVGGPVTLEAAAYGFLSGLALLTLLVIFATLNRAVAPYQLLRALPPVFFQVGVMGSIALSFIPQAAVSLREIREAQAIRGHRPRGLRDALPLLLPLLTTGLERSLQLAESLEARGFGSAPVHSPAGRRWGQGLLLLSLLLLLAGLLVRAGGGSGYLGTGLLLGGGAVLAAALVVQSRSVRRTRYRPHRWTVRDTLAALGLGLFLAAYALVLLRRPDLLAYSPYPLLGWPAFSPVLGALLLLLTAPAFISVLPPVHGLRPYNTQHETRGPQHTARKRDEDTDSQ